MRYLAVLWDSWREVLDSKVLYALLVLSVLVMIGVASISFTPRPAEQGLQDILGRFPGAQATFRAPPAIKYKVENFQQLDQRPPWEGAYQFDLAVEELPVRGRDGKEQPGEGVFRLLVWLSGLQLDEKDLTDEDREARKRLLLLQTQAQTVAPDKLEEFLNDKMREEIARVTPARMERFVKDQLAAQGTLETTSVASIPAADGKPRFEVQVQSRTETFRTWPHTVKYLFGAVSGPGDTSIGNLVYTLQSYLIGSWGAGIAMLVATIVTASFIPNMLRKGSIDLLLSKPVGRSSLLVWKYVGGLLFMLINTVVIVLGVWLILGLRSGLWPLGFLLSIFVLTFQFAIFYAVSTLFGTLTRSPIVAILAACATWVLLWLVGWGWLVMDATRELKPFPNWLYTTADTAHFVLPRYKDLDALSEQLLARDLLGPDSPQRKATDRLFGSIHWGQTVGFTLAFIALLLALACWCHWRRDY